MANRKLTTRPGRSVSYTEFKDLWMTTLDQRVPFDAGEMSGRSGNVHKFGSSPVAVREHIRNDQPDIDFVVYSYDTPIAWHTTDGWTFVDHVFTPTTSKHQQRLLMALDGQPLAIAGGVNRAAREAAARKQQREISRANRLRQKEIVEAARLASPAEAARRRSAVQTKYNIA